MEVSRAPDCCPSPANAFIDRLFRTLSDEDSTYRWAWTGPAGDDGLFYCDPKIGAGTPTLTMWPDRFYHSSQDTMDKVSPTMLRYGGMVMGTYAAFLAAAGRREALWLANETYRWSRGRIEALATSVIEREETTELDEHTAAPAERLAWLRDRSIDSLRSVTRFVPERQRPALLKQLAQFETLIKVDVVGAAERIKTMRGPEVLGDDAPAARRVAGADLVPKRLIGGYPAYDKLKPAQKKAFTKAKTGGLPGGVRGATLFYLCDGRRTIAEINHFLRGEFGTSNLRQLVNMFRLLDGFGYVKLK